MQTIPPSYLKSLDTAHRRAMLEEQSFGDQPTKGRDRRTFWQRLARGFEMLADDCGDDGIESIRTGEGD